MVEIDHKIIITGILSLTLIEMILIIFNHDSILLTSSILGAIGLAIGIVIPVPKIDNKSGVLKW
jgi:hypothetical protein